MMELVLVSFSIIAESPIKIITSVHQKLALKQIIQIDDLLTKDLETEIVKCDCPWSVEWEAVRWQTQ